VIALPISSVTLNPALDEAIAIDALSLGGANRCAFDALDPGGKGVNASRVIHRLGRETVAYGFAGGVTGAWLRERLQIEGVRVEFEEVDELTRINIMLYERTAQRRTRVYLPGPHVTATKLAALLGKLDAIPPESTAILGGSVPPGVPDTIYRDLVTKLSEKGVKTLVDISGAALEAVLSAKPLLVKPNVEEAEALLGRPLGCDEDVVAAALEIRGRGAEYVVISQGESGAIGVGPSGNWKAVAPRVAARSTIGSGDSMIGGLAIAFNEGASFKEGLRLGTATGAATAMVRGTQLCSAAQVEQLLSQGIAVNAIFTKLARERSIV
jgi:1-phosphofructokinase family hexose kinase